MSTALATRPDRGLETTVKGWITYAAGAFPEDIDDDKLKRAATRLKVAILASAEPAKLMKCSAESIGRCVALSAMTELYPGSGEMKPDVWLIPRGGELNWQMGAASYKRLALRAGYDLAAFLVFEGEPFRLFQGTDPRVEHEVDLEHEPTLGRLRGGYVVSTAPDGRRKIAWLTKERILQRRAVAQAKNVWKQWPLEMCEKTLYNYAGGREMFPLDEVTRRAIAADNQAETGGLQPPRAVAASSADDAVTAALSAGPQVIEATAAAEDESQEPAAKAEDESQGEAGGEEPQLDSEEQARALTHEIEEILGEPDSQPYKDFVGKMGPPEVWPSLPAKGIERADLLREARKLAKAKKGAKR